MKVLIINNETKHIEELIELFKGNDVNFCELWENFDQHKYDLYVLSWWSHHSIFFEPSPYQNEINFIKNTNKKVLWICLWAQIIAQVYDSIIDQLPQKINETINIIYNDKNYKVVEAHRYAIKKLWKNLDWLAKSVYGYEIIKHKRKPIRWVQFHPEIDTEKWIWKELLKIIIK